ncbi:carbohydrate ABC transporter permease [Desertihabitans aurantiacus]|uniref:carbohydrate ABC transporter permease n=1 Tax=Desertihabitans aurantiacus TaxID=2282477 RepID=UPI000DF824D7|nr:sugar ABC transporter permease [Desertihabitans aurantiacus]
MSVLTEPTASAVARPERRRQRRRAALQGWAFVAPLVIGIAVFQAYPLLVSLWASFHSWDGFTTPTWIGLDNFTAMPADELLVNSVKITLLFTLGSIPLTVVLALLLAVLCNRGGRISSSFFRTAYFTPYVTSIVAISLVFTQFFAPEGVINQVLGLVGIDGPEWLADSTFALVAVIVVAVWQGVGYPMVILLSGLQAIPKELYEAADVDGASPPARFFRITLPLLTPQLFFVLITQFILSFQIFGVVFVMTSGGPGNATSVFIYYVFQNAFSFGQLGYASAMAWAMFLFIVALTVIQLRLQKKWVFYA